MMGHSVHRFQRTEFLKIFTIYRYGCFLGISIIPSHWSMFYEGEIIFRVYIEYNFGTLLPSEKQYFENQVFTKFQYSCIKSYSTLKDLMTWVLQSYYKQSRDGWLLERGIGGK